MNNDAQPPSTLPAQFDHPLIIRLHGSYCAGLCRVTLISAVLTSCYLIDAMPHCTLPICLLMAHSIGQRTYRPLLKLHHQQWSCFVGLRWSPAQLDVEYVGPWLMSFKLNGHHVIIWPDSCSQREGWYLRRALLARQRASQQKQKDAGRWVKMWCRILRG